MARPLTPRQAAFVQQYLVDLNATQAAIRAGYSEKTAGRTAHENLKKPEIAQAIQEAQAERAERLEVTQDDVVRGLHKEATLEGEGSSHSARVAAWAHLGKHLGMFTEKVELSGEVKRAEPATPPERALSAAATALRRNGITN